MKHSGVDMHFQMLVKNKCKDSHYILFRFLFGKCEMDLTFDVKWISILHSIRKLWTVISSLQTAGCPNLWLWCSDS